MIGLSSKLKLIHAGIDLTPKPKEKRRRKTRIKLGLAKVADRVDKTVRTAVCCVYSGSLASLRKSVQSGLLH